MAAGKVTPEAAKAFEAGLRGQGESAEIALLPRARQAGAGRPTGALQDWAALAKDLPPDAEWQPLLRQRIADAAKAEGIDPASVLPSGAASPGTQGAALPSAPAASDMPSRRRRRRRESDRGRFPGRPPRDGREHGRAPRLPPRTAARRCRGLGAARPLLHGAGSAGKARDAYSRAATLRPDDAALVQALAEATKAAAAAKTGGGSRQPR